MVKDECIMPETRETVTIEKLVEGGWGLARKGREVLFVRGAIPGETVTVDGGVAHKGYREVSAQEVLAASPDRVGAPCVVYGACGGCQLQHIRYEAQLLFKHAMLKETLRRVGKLEIESIPLVTPSPNPYGYRATIRFAVFRDQKEFALGFHKLGTKEMVPGSRCLLVPDSTREAVAAVSTRLANQTRMPVRLKSIEVRRSQAFGSLLLIFRTGPADRSRAHLLMKWFQDIPGLVGQVVIATDKRGEHRWVSGDDWIADSLDDVTFRISDRSFMQSNWSVNQTLSQTISDWVKPSLGMRILELYAGIGTLGLPLARRGALVTEVETNPYALSDGRHTAKANHIGRCRFRHQAAEALLEAAEADAYEVVVVDPPRTGLSPVCVQHLSRLRFPRILYLSCQSPTLARDLGRFQAAGYQISRVQPFDMFPQTAHLETLVELVHT